MSGMHCYTKIIRRRLDSTRTELCPGKRVLGISIFDSFLRRIELIQERSRSHFVGQRIWKPISSQRHYRVAYSGDLGMPSWGVKEKGKKGCVEICGAPATVTSFPIDLWHRGCESSRCF